MISFSSPTFTEYTWLHMTLLIHDLLFWCTCISMIWILRAIPPYRYGTVVPNLVRLGNQIVIHEIPFFHILYNSNKEVLHCETLLWNITYRGGKENVFYWWTHKITHPCLSRKPDRVRSNIAWIWHLAILITKICTYIYDIFVFYGSSAYWFFSHSFI